MEGHIVAPDVVCVLFQVFRNVSPAFDLGCHHSCAVIDIFKLLDQISSNYPIDLAGRGRGDICSCAFSVADPGCLSWISDPNFFHPGSRVKRFRIPDPDSHQRI
jgi:hypothetical protein